MFDGTADWSPHSLAACGVLIGVWAVSAVGVWQLAEWRFTAWLVTALAGGLACVFAGGIVASHRNERVWQWTFGQRLDVPNWLWIGGATAAVCWPTVAFVGLYDLSVAGWLLVTTVGCSYTAAVMTGHSWLRRRLAWPVWVAVAAGGVVVGVAGVVTLGGWPFLNGVVFVAILLLTLQVVFILPASLSHAVSTTEPEPLESPPLVSVLIPAYNEEGFVGDCIASVLDSTYPSDRLELFVIDDGSTDETYEEAAAYRDEGVQVLRRDNGGKHAALNLGLCCAAGSVIVTVDADSRPHPTAITRMVAALQANPTVGAYSASVLPANDHSPLTVLQRVEYVLSNTNRRAFSTVAAVPVVPGCLGIYRREAVEGVWGFDPDTITEDFDLTVQLLKDGWEVKHGPGLVHTHVPDDWRTLWRQRLRWYHGSFETIRKHWQVLLEPRYKHVHALAMPVRCVSQFFTPVGSYVIFGAVVWQLLTAPSVTLLALCGVFLALTILIGLFCLFLDREPVRYVAYLPFLFVGYKQFVDLTVAAGTVRALIGDERW